MGLFSDYARVLSLIPAAPNWRVVIQNADSLILRSAKHGGVRSVDLETVPTESLGEVEPVIAWALVEIWERDSEGEDDHERRVEPVYRTDSRSVDVLIEIGHYGRFNDWDVVAVLAPSEKPNWPALRGHLIYSIDCKRRDRGLITAEAFEKAHPRALPAESFEHQAKVDV